jgi:hypothetical protein
MQSMVAAPVVADIYLKISEGLGAAIFFNGKET